MQRSAMQEMYELVKEVKAGLEIVHGSNYNNFLNRRFRVLCSLLTHRIKPEATENSDEHQLRNAVLEILSKLPVNQVLRPYVQELMRVALHVLMTDNEENGLICMRIVTELHRNCTSSLETEVQPFLDFVHRVYHNFKATVDYFFDYSTGNDSELATSQHSIGLQRPIPGQLNPSFRSFKIITECPLITMIIFRFHQKYMTNSVAVLLPLMVGAISIAGPNTQDVPANLKNQHVQFKYAQVKTLSFLTYLLQNYSTLFKQYEDIISNSIVNLFDTCPHLPFIRKDLINAANKFVKSDLKRGFFPHIEKLLDERVLVGIGKACEPLRPMAYNILVELIYHVRMEISFDELSKIIYMYSRIMDNPLMPMRIHANSAALMLNLIKLIVKFGVDPTNKEKAQALLGTILQTFVRTLRKLKHTIPQLIGDCEAWKEYCSLRSNLEMTVEATLMPLEHSVELSDCKQLIRNIVQGMNTLLYGLTLVNKSVQPSGSSHGLKGIREQEVRLTLGVLKNGVKCLCIFKDEKEEKEMLLHFSNMFVGMKNRNLMDVFAPCMTYLFDCMLKNDQLLTVFSNLLETPEVARHFADVLVNFLVSTKLDILKQPDTPASKQVLHLFQLLFVAVAKFPADCECVLQPHVSTLVDVSLKNAAEVEKPHGYLQLLHSMFHALSGAKLEFLFEKFIPSLQPCINLLLAMVEGPLDVDMKDLVLELCLRIPARLSSLLPHLPRLKKPLLLALRGSDQLIDLGLRTLEFWIDNLKPEFLETSMENAISEIFLTLSSHIRPKPYPWGEKALQLLGKLGGENRRFLKEPLALECKENSEHGLRLMLTFDQSITFQLSMDRCVNLAIATVMENRSDVGLSHRRYALKFLHVCLSSVLNLIGNVPREGVTSGLLGIMLMPSKDPSRCRTRTTNRKDENEDPRMKTKTQLMAEQSVFKVLLMTVIAASSEPELQDPKDEFVPNVCRHFSMIFHMHLSTTSSSVTSGQLGGSMGRGSGDLSSTSQSSSHSSLIELDPLIFLDALVDLLAAENRAHAKAALNAMNIFVETLLFLACCKQTVVLTQSSVGTPGPSTMVTSPSMIPVFAPPPGVHIAIFEQLLARLLHCCYGSTWQAQMGGVMGFGALVGKVTIETLCLFQVRAIRSLVFVLGRLPQHAIKEQAETSKVLDHLLRVLNCADDANREQYRQSFQEVVDFFAAKLFNPNTTLIVRKAVRSCLALLAGRTGIEVSELLEPLYQPLFQPLIMHRLRSKDIEQQVGIVTAITFSLPFRPPLLKMSGGFTDVLDDALQIMEEDENLSAGKFMIPNLVVKLTKLRTVCIELLRVAMDLAEFETLTKMGCRIISVFFQSLSCRNPEIATIAKDGLQQVIIKENLPERVIRPNLRLIIKNSLNTVNFTMPMLQGLARSIELIPLHFHVKFGEKLLGDLKMLQQPEKLAQSQKAWKAGEEPKIVAAFIELFHLLRPEAGELLDDLVELTMEFEAALPQHHVFSELTNPYRLPLTKYLNRYASHAVDYFLVRLNRPKHFRRFIDIIRSEAGQPLRDELAKSSDKIIATAFPQAIRNPFEPVNSAESAGQMPDAHFHGISLVSTLVKLIPEWLYNNRAVFDTLVLLWKSSSRQARVLNEQSLSIEQVTESKKLVKCFLSYLRHDQSEVAVLFDMLSIFLVGSRIDYTFLKQFYIIEVAEGYTLQMKKAILVKFLSLFQSKESTQNQIVIAMQMLILPMLDHAFQNGLTRDIIDSCIIKTIVEKLFYPPGEVIPLYDEPLRIELLQLSTLLLKYLPNDLMDHRETLSKFGRNHLGEDESASKQWAFVNVCQILVAYNVPLERIFEVLVILLKRCKENKLLAQRALDILIPALPRINPSKDNNAPKWILLMKTILVEEWHSSDNLIHILQLIVRHSDLFYTHRDLFVILLLNSLTPVGLPDSQTLENRCLAIQIAGLIVTWEKQRRAESKAALDICTPLSAGPHKGFKPNSAMQEEIIKFLIKVSLLTNRKDRKASEVYTQAIEMLSQALELWPTANVNFHYLEKALEQSTDLSTNLAHGLDVMNKVLEKQPRLFIPNNIKNITQILGACFNGTVMDIGKSLCTSLKMIFNAFPLNDINTQHDVRLLHSKVVELIQNHLAEVSTPQISHDTTAANLRISLAVSVIKALAEGQKDFIDSFMMPLIGVLQRLTREIRMLTSSTKNQVHSINHEPSAATERLKSDLGAVTSNLKSTLQLVSGRGMLVPECKCLISQIVQSLLSEEGTDASVLLTILHMIKDWIENDFRSSSSGISNVVLHLERLSQVDRQMLSTPLLEEWDAEYLQLLYGLCSDSTMYPLPVRQEVFQKVEQKYMLGLRAKDPEMRKKFLSLYHESIGKTVFARLEYIIQTQEWEALGDVFWLKQGLDLLLAISIENKPIELAPNSAQVPPLFASGAVPQHAGMQQVGDAPEAIAGAPPTFTEFVNKHATFLNEASKHQVGDVLSLLRELAHTDANVAYHLWVLVFDNAWHSLQEKEQQMLAKPMSTLLCKDYHIRQKDKRPNVIQALLEGVFLCSPRPKIRGEVIKYLAKRYNAWHIATSIIESHVVQFPCDTSFSDALAELYRMLNEEDLRYGLWKKMLITPEIRAGLSLFQHGYWQRAQDLFYRVMNKTIEGTQDIFWNAEMRLCEERWLSCARQLSQWEILVDYAKEVENYEILLDCLWRIPDWVYLKENVFLNAQVEDTPKLCFVKAYLALHDGSISNVSEAENILAPGVDLALNHWWELPEMSLESHLPLLQQFQQSVELQESARVLVKISNGYNQHVGTNPPGGVHGSYADLTGIFETWRLRTPNRWDDLSVWNDLLQWRNHIYEIVINSFKDFSNTNPQLSQLGYGEKTWSANKFAHVARKQGVYDVCVTELNKMDDYSTMEPQDTFVKITEQAKAYLEMGGELTTGINLLGSTNLETFPAQHRAEIFRLKGDFFLKMNQGDNANVSYSSAIGYSKNLAKGWISWGNYCDQVYKENNEEISLEYTVSCFIQGIRYGVSNAGCYLARVLYLLSFDTRNKSAGRAFDKYFDQIPRWIWLPWIPHLLLSLQRPEASHCKVVLLKIATDYPQALYYSLRTYCLERGNLASQSELGASGEAALKAATEVMLALRNNHKNLASELQFFLKEIHNISILSPEEKLLSLLDQLVEESNKHPIARKAEVPQPLKDKLSILCRSFFSADCAKNYVQFVNEYKRDFENHLDPHRTSTFPATMADFIERLKQWKNVLQTNVEHRFPGALKLEEESSALCEFHWVDVEVPGQYFADQDIAPDHRVKLDRIGADLATVRRHGRSFRRWTLIGSDGSRNHFLIRPAVPSEERMVQLFRVLNRFFNKHKESRRRHLAFHTPVTIAAWPQASMVEDDLMYSTLGEAYEFNCARYNRDPDRPMSFFKKDLDPAITGRYPPEFVADLRLQIYNRITSSKMVNDTLFCHYMYKTLRSCDHLWVFRKHFTVQLALSSFMSYMLQIGERVPNRILFAKNTGKIFQNNFELAYNDNGMIEFNETVPFRLTPNLESFLRPFGVEGPFVSAMCAAAQSIIAQKSQRIQHHLEIFFKDELLSWSWKRSLVIKSAPAAADDGINPVELKQKVTTNVEQVMGRIRGIAPQCFPEEDEPPQSVQRGVTELVEAAREPKNLCMMDPTWHPWF